MSIEDHSTERTGIFIPPGEGRSYPMGRISTVFKADGDETQNQFPGGFEKNMPAIAEWFAENPPKDA